MSTTAAAAAEPAKNSERAQWDLVMDNMRSQLIQKFDVDTKSPMLNAALAIVVTSLSGTVTCILAMAPMKIAAACPRFVAQRARNLASFLKRRVFGKGAPKPDNIQMMFVPRRIALPGGGGGADNDTFRDLAWFLDTQQLLNRGTVEYGTTTAWPTPINTAYRSIEYVHEFRGHSIRISALRTKPGRLKGPKSRDDAEAIAEAPPPEIHTYRLTTDAPNLTVIKDFCKHVRARRVEALTRDSWRQTVFTWTGTRWSGRASNNRRTLDTLVLPEDKMRLLRNDIETFVDSEAWYAKMGLAWNRGYLLHGKPGCGKTSVIKALSYTYKLDIYSLNVAMVTNDAYLQLAFADIPDRAMLVIEDADCMGSVMLSRATQPDSDPKAVVKPATVTLSCLLNLLDGASSSHGRVTVITSNHADRLDPALIRPGRCDLSLELETCAAAEIARFFSMFYGRPYEAAQFAHVPPGLISPALLSSTLLSHRDDPEAGMARFDSILAASAP